MTPKVHRFVQHPRDDYGITFGTIEDPMLLRREQAHAGFDVAWMPKAWILQKLLHRGVQAANILVGPFGSKGRDAVIEDVVEIAYGRRAELELHSSP